MKILVCRNDRLNEKISALPPEGVLVKLSCTLLVCDQAEMYSFQAVP